MHLAVRMWKDIYRISLGECPAYPSKEPRHIMSHCRERPTCELPLSIHGDLGWRLICSNSFFLIFLFSYWKVTSINKYLPKLSKFFLLAKYYVVKLQLLVQIQTSKCGYILEKEWKNLDSFRIATDERFQSLESKIKAPCISLLFFLSF